jgi:hypothetical protein
MADLHVYVAGAWLEQATRAKPVIRALRSKGVRITHDWTLPDGHPDLATPAEVIGGSLAGPAPMKKDEYKLDTVVRRGYALADLRGVREADLVYLAVPGYEGRGAGCFVETGYALALGKPVVFAGVNWKATIFADLGIGRYDTDEEAIKAVCG